MFKGKIKIGHTIEKQTSSSFPPFILPLGIGRRCIFLALLMLAGCSTIVNGPTQDIVVTSNPPGATITPTDYKCWVKTPGIITLDRTNSTILTARLYGYEDSKQEIKCELSLCPIVTATTELLIYPGLIFTMLDCNTGSIGHLTPTEIHFELISK